MQPFPNPGGLNGGIWTGYMRNGSANNYDPWMCSSLKHGGNSYLDSIGLYEMDYDEFGSGTQDHQNGYNYVYMRRTAPNWFVTKSASFLTGRQYTVCEMNCEYFEGEFDPIVFDPTYSPDVDDACQARNEGEFPCESAQLESKIKIFMMFENFLLLLFDTNFSIRRILQRWKMWLL